MTKREKILPQGMEKVIFSESPHDKGWGRSVVFRR